MKYINGLREGLHVSDIYLCKIKQIQLTKAGKEYGSLILQDKTGTLDAKIWDLGSPGICDFDSLDYVHVDGDVTSFNGSLQLNVKRIRKADEGEYIQSDYLPISSKNIDEMYKELLEKIASIKNKYYRALLEEFFVKDLDFIKRFRFSSAAKSVHHGFVGGLLEHTLSLSKLCEYYCVAYPTLNRDLLITAAIFHDIGKIEELSAFPENDYTDAGQLLGHIIIGTDMISGKARTIADFPNKFLNELLHCIIAHHGELEYGSPKKPAIMEALALSLADNTDAKMQTFKEILDGAGDNNSWLGYNKFLETNIRKSSRE